jgi:hypothetical protein
MRKSKNLKLENSWSRLFDGLVAALCIAGAALFIHYFQLDFNKTLSRQNEQPVGTITYKYKAVQRRFVDRVLWDRLQRESPVYDGDFIRTEDLSEATVFFSGGGIVDLAENSLIQIFAKDSLPRLDVSEGGVNVNAQNSDFVVSSGGNTVKVDTGGIVSTRTGPEGQLGLWVSEGKATVSTPGGVHEASAGSAVSLNKDGAAESLPMTAVLSPRPGARLISNQQSGLPVEFVFKPINYSGERTRLEISVSRNFETFEFARDLDANQVTVNFTPGVFWWRAYPAQGGEAPSSAAAGKLSIHYSPAPALLTPTAAQLFTYKTDYPQLRFRWSEDSQENPASHYLLEIADNPALNNPQVRIQARTSSALHSGLGAGRWYWRVTPGFSAEYDGSPAPSSVSSFTIMQSDALPPPSLMAPAPETVFSLDGEREDIWFSWKPGTEAEAYTIRISRSRDLTNPRITETNKNTYYVYNAQNTALESGRYFWGVFGTIRGTDTQLSPVWSFIAGTVPPEAPATPAPVVSTAPVTAPSPPKAEPAPAPAPVVPQVKPANNFVFRADHLRGASGIDFSWTPAGNYTFTLFQEGAAQRSILSTSVLGDSFTLSDLTILSRGQYMWQIKAGNRIVAENRFTINIPPVRKLELRDIGTVFSIRSARSAHLMQRISWFRDENAARYELVVEAQDEENNFREIFRTRTQNGFAEVPVDSGLHRFKLRIFNLLNQFEYETNWATFTIILAR